MKHPRDEGFSLIELLLVVAVILVIAAIAIPSLVHARMAANEASAVGSLRTMNSAIVNYCSNYGIGYPVSLANLAPSSSPSSSSADLLDPVLASGLKGGYGFTYSPGAPDSHGIINSFTLTADPMSRGNSGQRGFYTDQGLVIRANATGTASVTDPVLN
jgi:type IV pilus assembly protein PilA